jgi:hypothetical protein
MRSLLAGLLALVAVIALVSPAAALPPAYPDGCYVWKPRAPDMYTCNGCCCPPPSYGMVCAPNCCCVYPCFPPFQGVLPKMEDKVPTHPYARSPRDYFMYEERGRQ